MEKNPFLEFNRNQEWNRVGHVKKIKIFKAGIDFSSTSKPPQLPLIPPPKIECRRN
jgi:hypothetical protein